MGENHLQGRRWDAAVVGAGPAGAVAACGLARHGLSVLLMDRAAFPRWKVCGCCLNPAAQAVLQALGLEELPRRCGAVRLEKMSLAIGARHADIALPGWLALSRERLDAALVQAAQESGATFWPGTQAALGPAVAEGRELVLRSGGQEQSVTAGVVLAADGLGSRLLAGEAEAEVRLDAGSRVGAGVVVERAPGWYAAGVVYMAYGRSGYVGLVRREDGLLNLAAAFDTASLRAARAPGVLAAQLLSEAGWPALAGLAELPWRGTPALTRESVRPAAERVLAIGDAAGYVEPFTGEGIGWALASGAAVVDLARAATSGWTPELADRWVKHHQKTKARRQGLCRAITWVSRRPSLARVLVSVVHQWPWLATPFVNWVGRSSGGSLAACRL